MKSVLQPAKNGGRGADQGAAQRDSCPSMLQTGSSRSTSPPTRSTTTARANRATYTGNAQLWQGETSIKGATIVLDDKTGDLTATGTVATVTVTMLQETDKDKKKERVRSIATAKDFSTRRRSHRRPTPATRT